MAARRLAYTVGLFLVIAGALGTRASAAQGLPDGFTSLTLNYCDPDGAGTLTITSAGTDDATNGTVIGVSLMQNGGSFSGVGLALQTSPQVYLIAFAFGGPAGDIGFFDATLTRGIDSWSAQGTYRLGQSPGQGTAWRAIVHFPALPASCG